MLEKELIIKLKSSDNEAFKLLVETYQDKVTNTSFGFTHNIADAEDIAQEVFIEIYKSINRFREDSKLSTWIYRITVTKSLDFIKTNKRKKRFAIMSSLFYQNDEPIQIHDDTNNNPLENLEEQENKKALHLAINKLAQNQKIALTLNKFEDLSYKEIAEIMDISLSSVESLIFRARTNLKKSLKYYFEKNLS